MKMSTKGRYGLRVMVELAAQHGQGTVLAENIAENQNISENYIHLLVKQLKEAGLIHATRGRNGGYAISRDPEKITVLDVINAMEGKISVVECTSNTAFCNRNVTCVTREVWVSVNQAVEKALQSITIAQLVSKKSSLEAAQAYLEARARAN